MGKQYTIEEVNELSESVEGKQRNFRNLVGKKFNRLTVVAFAGNRRWFSLCDCGNYTKSPGQNLESLKTTSCGCYSKEVTASNRKIDPNVLEEEIKNKHPSYTIIDRGDGKVASMFVILLRMW